MAGLVLGMVASIVVARALQPAGKGVFATVRASASLAAAIPGLGVGKSLVYFVSRGELNRNELSANALALSILSGLVATGVFVHLLYFASGASEPIEGIPLVVVVALPLAFVFSIQDWTAGYLRGRQKFVLLNSAAAMGSVVYLAVLLPLAWLQLLTPATALAALALSVVLPLGLHLLGMLKDGALVFPGVHWSVTKILLSYGLAYQAYGLVQNLHYRLDLLLISRFLDETEVGYYSTSANIAQLTWNLPVSFTFVLIPLVAGTADESRSAKRTAQVVRLTALLLVLAAFLMGIAAEWLIPLLYGEAYLPSVTPLRLLLPGMISSGLFLVLGGHLLGLKKLRPLLVIACAGLVMNVGLNLWLIPVYGIEGAAVVSSITYTVVFVAVGVLVSRISQVPLRDLLVIKRGDVEAFVDRGQGLISRFREAWSGWLGG